MAKVDAEIELLDNKIEERIYIDKANNGTISHQEMNYLSQLLRERDQLFAVKAEILLSQD